MTWLLEIGVESVEKINIWLHFDIINTFQTYLKSLLTFRKSNILTIYGVFPLDRSSGTTASTPPPSSPSIDFREVSLFKFYMKLKFFRNVLYTSTSKSGYLVTNFVRREIRFNRTVGIFTSLSINIEHGFFGKHF